MTTAIASAPAIVPAGISAETIEQVIIHSDLRKLTSEQKVSYYKSLCDAAGLDSRLNPFEYIVLNGKETLYAKKSCTDQLRNNRKINVQIVAREKVGDCYVVTARAMMPGGREDESIGAVNISNAKGESLANALMKAETKAKRRVTLSICGLGILDETELETIPAYRDSNVARGSLKDRLKGEELVNAAKQNLGAEVVAVTLSPQEEADWLQKYNLACNIRGMSNDTADAIYKEVTGSDKFKKAYEKNPKAAWERLISKVEAGELDRE